jgi:hypothetical protein
LAANAEIEFSSRHQFNRDVGAAYSARQTLSLIDEIAFALGRALGSEFIPGDHEAGLYANFQQIN